MSEHDEKGEERVEDLDVPESESEDVKGGLNYSKIEVDYLSGGGAHKVQPGIGKKIKPGGGRFGDGSV